MKDQNDNPVAKQLNAFQAPELAFKRGIERESLRVDRQGTLSKKPHPDAFGSKLCHPTITTDFSEGQLELITPASTDIEHTFGLMERVHAYVTRNLEDETLWAASMPCVLQGDTTIPLAYYGDSNIGKLKTTYRNGLGNRYGRAMQTICAVHYNFSFPSRLWETLATIEGETNDKEYQSRRYFDLMRNFRRFSWLLIYLFGASPAVCNSFVKGRTHGLEPFDEGTLHLPYATSLRSGNLGYQSDAQSDAINVCYNGLDNYVSSLARAVRTPYLDYQKLGIHKDGEYLQLNDSVLQSEAEFYSTIRAKRVSAKGQNFLQSLQQDGVEYIEVRLMDLDPFEPIGVSRTTARFLDTFLLYCLLSPSPAHDEQRCAEVKANLVVAVHEGRRPGVTLKNGDTDIELATWASNILTELESVASHLDTTLDTKAHTESLTAQQEKVTDSSKTPSARILQIMKQQSIPFFRFAMNQSLAHQQYHLAEALSSAELEGFAQQRLDSIEAQKQIEAADAGPFEDYLKRIMAAYDPLIS